MTANSNSFLSKWKNFNSDISNSITDNGQLRIVDISKLPSNNNNLNSVYNKPKLFFISTKKNNKIKLLDNEKLTDGNTQSKSKEKEKHQKNTINILKVTDYKTKYNTNRFYKSKTQANFLITNDYFNDTKNPKNLPNITSNLKMNKTKNNSFINSQLLKNNIIYFNSSMNDNYNKNNLNNNNIDLLLELINEKKYSKIFKTFKSYRKNRLLKNIKLSQKLKENNTNNDLLEDKNEKINTKIFKGLGIFTMNKSILETLFRKTPLKIKTGVLTNVSKEKFNTNLLLNPFSNSYGHILSDLSVKLGFMKDSINMIYPMVRFKGYESLKKNNELCKKIKIKKMNNKYKIEGLDSNETINKNYIKLYNTIKPKRIIKHCFTKYPINIPRKGEKAFSSKIYSLRRRQKSIQID